MGLEFAFEKYTNARGTLELQKGTLTVEYFNQPLGAAHSKRWSKKSFSAFILVQIYNT